MAPPINFRGGPAITPSRVISGARPTRLRRLRPNGEEPMRFFTENGGRPGDERGFVHKKLLAIGTKFLGGAAEGLGTKIFGGGGRTTARPTVPRTHTARVSGFSEAEKRLGQQLKFPSGGGNGASMRGFVETGRGGGQGGQDTCPRGMRVDWQTGRCEAAAGQEVGEAIMGRYGAALMPGVMTIDRAVCLRGMHLGDDGLCYNRSQISNKQRMWPAGRKPLLTGGDMRAISIAARAGRRLEGATKRLQRIGLMKKPTSRRQLPRGRGTIIKEAGAGSVTVQ